MNKQNGKIVEVAKIWLEAHPGENASATIAALLDIIEYPDKETEDLTTILEATTNEAVQTVGENESLKAQLREIEKAGEFIRSYVKYLNTLDIDDKCDIIITPGGNEVSVLAENFRRLAEALKEAEEK